MLPSDKQARALFLLTRVRLLFEIVLGAAWLGIGAWVMTLRSGPRLLDALGFISMVAAVVFPIARSASFVALAGVGSRRLRQTPERPPSLILLAAAIDIPMLLAFSLGSGVLPGNLPGKLALTMVLLAWDVALIVLSLRFAGADEAKAARPAPVVLRVAPSLANALCVLLWIKFLGATQELSPPRELTVDASAAVKAPLRAPSIDVQLVDEATIWSLRTTFDNELVRVDLAHGTMQYRFPLPDQLTVSDHAELRGALRQPDGERLLLVHSTKTQDLYVLAARPSGGLRTLFSITPHELQAQLPAGDKSDSLEIMGWSLTDGQLELITRDGLHIVHALAAGPSAVVSVRRIPGCEERFNEIRWAARQPNGWRLLIELYTPNGHKSILRGPEGEHPLEGEINGQEPRVDLSKDIDLSAGNVMARPVDVPRYQVRNNQLVEVKPPPPVPANFVPKGGHYALSEHGLRYVHSFCNDGDRPCMLPQGSNWVRCDYGLHGVQLSLDPAQAGASLVHPNFSVVFLPQLLTWQERSWLFIPHDSQFVELRKSLAVVPLGFWARLRRAIPTDASGVERKLEWMGAKAGGYEGESSVAAVKWWNIIKYLPLALGPIFSLLFVLLNHSARARRILQIAALGYLMLCLLAGPLLWTELEYF